MSRTSRVLLSVFLALVVLAVGVGLGIVVDRYLLPGCAANAGLSPQAADQFRLVCEAWNLLDRHYVDRPALESPKLAYTAISSMVDSLGDTGHSRFLTPEMVQHQADFTRGQFEGIGAYVEMRDGQVVVVAPIDDSPAQEAGIRAGDLILQVDGEDVTGQTLDSVVSRILGPKGTTVTLTIHTPATGLTRDLTLTRAQITIKNVVWQRLPDTDLADVRIAAFSQGVSADLHAAVTQVEAQGLKGIVLDLRSNPGGLLDEAIGTASLFLASGNVLIAKDADGQETPMPVREDADTVDLPLVVLVDAGTASAAEIVSGALQDAGRAKVLGETTFGTGTVLNQFGLADGSALLLATQLWLTPSGRVIWRHGITPDEQVPLAADASPLFPGPGEPFTAAELNNSHDLQLVRAIELLEAAVSALSGQP